MILLWIIGGYLAFCLVWFIAWVLYFQATNETSSGAIGWVLFPAIPMIIYGLDLIRFVKRVLTRAGTRPGPDPRQ